MMANREMYNNCNPASATFPSPPAGLDALYSACVKLYPTQPNPLQVTAVVKYWLGGPDPLDYISMYSHPGDAERNIPPHWHYISFGLSDLHGDGRVHEASSNDTPSGFGFELSFRLKRELQETAPPTWPATVMQSLSKYVFQSENNLCIGDHVSWHCPLDNSESRIQHMLMTEDAQLKIVETPFGQVQFVQIVGVCAEELQAAQHWNGPGVTDLLTKVNGRTSARDGHAARRNDIRNRPPRPGSGGSRHRVGRLQSERRERAMRVDQEIIEVVDDDVFSFRPTRK